MPMTDQQFQSFADNYTAADFDKIRYDWNGKSGQEFHDSNYAFRIELSQYLIPQIETVKEELVQALYVEQLKPCPATFGCYLNIHIYAQELFTRDWRKYLWDYMKAAEYGMDAFLSTGRINIGKELAQQISAYITDLLATSTDIREKNILEAYDRRFQWLANRETPLLQHSEPSPPQRRRTLYGRLLSFLGRK